jgi:hypothetical protein
MTDIGTSTPEKLDCNLRRMLNDVALRHDLSIDQDDTPRAFNMLLGASMTRPDAAWW